MKHLYAPWRESYIRAKKYTDCVFCIEPEESATSAARDAELFILHRYTHCFVMLNRFPYNGGHLLVIPYEHRASLTDCAPEILHEMIEVGTLATAILSKACKAEGFNIGFNLGGPAAGGSIPEHLHMHVLPRWQGDTGFLTTLADTKPVSVNLPALYDQLKAFFITTAA